MPNYIYKTDPKAVEEIYTENTNKSIYSELGDVNFGNVKLLVVAKNEEEADAIRKGITDARMWVLDLVQE